MSTLKIGEEECLLRGSLRVAGWSVLRSSLGSSRVVVPGRAPRPASSSSASRGVVVVGQERTEKTEGGQKKEGTSSASRCPGGKDDPQLVRPGVPSHSVNSRRGSPSSDSSATDNQKAKWVPPSINRDALALRDRSNVIFRKVRG